MPIMTMLEQTEKSTESTIPSSILLSGISWQSYESLLEDFSDNSAVRLTYNQGKLEIMNPPLPVHGEYSILIDRFIFVLSEELNLNIHSLDPTTLSRNDLQKGAEPDKCYYIYDESSIRNRNERNQALDLTQFSPPDLIVEVDITHFSIDKLSIYLAMGVPEIWRYDGEKLYIYQLSDDKQQYVECERSLTFADFPLKEKIPEFMEQSFKIGQMAVLKQFRQWVKLQKN